jgi:hypothetical protein
MFVEQFFKFVFMQCIQTEYVSTMQFEVKILFFFLFQNVLLSGGEKMTREKVFVIKDKK